MTQHTQSLSDIVCTVHLRVLKHMGIDAHSKANSV